MSSSGTKSPNERMRPAAYQLVPLLKILENGLDAVLVADGVGVGKTISACYILRYFSARLGMPSVVVCPPGLVDKWRIELRSKFDSKTLPIRAKEDLATAVDEITQTPGNPAIYVMASSLLQERRLPKPERLGVLVFDEIHNYRNAETISFNTAKEMARLAKFRVGLSATPINNCVDDLSSEINILLPDYSWDVVDTSVKDSWASDRLAVSIPLTTRFTKERLGIHFARRDVHTSAVNYGIEYRDWFFKLIERRTDSTHESPSVLENLTYFRMAASSPYAVAKAFGKKPPFEDDPKLATIAEIIASVASTHVIVFCEFRDTVEYLADSLSPRTVFTITGDTPVFERMSTIQAFRNSASAILIMTSVGSEGLDLQFCDSVVNYDLHWNPMKIEQRIGRIDRVGQKKSQIQIFNIVVVGSIDERVISVLERKLSLLIGSVFELGSILRPSGKDAIALVDKNTLQQELRRGEALVSAVELTSSIPQTDYEVLPFVKLSFCSSSGIRQAGERGCRAEDFCDDGAVGWIRSVKNESKRFQDLLGFYS